VYLLEFVWTNDPQAPSYGDPTKQILQRILILTLSARSEQLHAPSLVSVSAFWSACLPRCSTGLLLSYLGRVSEPALHKPKAMLPFGAADLRPTLFIVGLQSAYTILSSGNNGTIFGTGHAGGGCWPQLP